MPWEEASLMDERVKFIAALRNGMGMGEACRRFGISRKTGYKWLERFEQHGPAGLEDRSRAPHRRPWAISPEVSDLIIAVRCKHPRWGPRKLIKYLTRREPQVTFPAPSTVGELLRRRGFVKSRRRRARSAAPHTGTVGRYDEPNSTWCADFKGWFRVGDGTRCDPLTITDGCSRYLLCCHAVQRPTYEHVKRRFELAFREYGLPTHVRTDNGPPFASTGLGGLSRLSVWFVKLGITPDRIQPGKPQQNGRHERMHRTLGAETAAPPASTIRAQQRRFDVFRTIYNDERPHEALGGDTPGAHYTASRRPFPSELPTVEYPSGSFVRVVRSNGTIKWRSSHLYVSESLIGERVGLEALDEGRWMLRFAHLPLGIVDDRGTEPTLIRI